MKKILSSIIITFLVSVFFCLNFGIDVNANLEGWSYPSEWEMVYYQSNPVLVDMETVTDSKHTSKVFSTCEPFFEYQITVLKAYDYSYSKWYMGLVVNFWLSPNNISNDNSRSDLVKITTAVPNGSLIDGGPYSQSSSTTITTSIGGNLSIGFQGNMPTGSISGSFTSSKTKTIYDLTVSAYREKINSSDSYARQFRVNYDYYDPYRNNVAYLESTSKLQYAVIYIVNNPTAVSMDLVFNARTVYDYWLWNATVSQKETLEISGNLLTGNIVLA